METDASQLDVRDEGKRPFGIYAVIALLLLDVVGAVLDVVRIQLGLPSIVLEAVAKLLQSQGSLTLLASTLVSDDRVLVWIHLAIVLILIFVIVGLWMRMRWAWVATMALIGIGLVYDLWSYFAGAPLFINMLTHVITVFYLNERSVQRAFERAPRPAAEGVAA